MKELRVEQIEFLKKLLAGGGQCVNVVHDWYDLRGMDLPEGETPEIAIDKMCQGCPVVEWQIVKDCTYCEELHIILEAMFKKELYNLL
jgi:hypothetical protein